MYVFTSPTCPHCPAAKKIASEVANSRDDVVYKDVVSGMPGSERLFRKFDISSVPTIIIRGPAYPNNIGLRGVQSRKTLNKYINLALGLESLPEKSSSGGFLKKLFGKKKED